MSLIHQVIDGVPREAEVPDDTVAIWQDSGWVPGPWPGRRDDFGVPLPDDDIDDLEPITESDQED